MEQIEAGWHLVTATCRNEECQKNGEAVPGIAVPDVPEDWNFNGVQCGTCGQAITDVVAQ